MRAILLLTGMLALAPPVVCAHIGSPNVIFEGRAGAYPLRVIIRPPGVVPGLATIDIRVLTNGVHKVTVLPVHWRAGEKGAPPPDEARPVLGEPNLFHAELWLMTSGSYSVQVKIEGERGSGISIVPVNSIATRRLPMPRLLGVGLAALGVFLFLAAAAIAGSAARESVLMPGAEPGRGQIWRGRTVTMVTAILLGAALMGGWHWWKVEDSDYRNNRMFRPTPVTATARTEDGQRIVRLVVDDPRFGREGSYQLVPDHGKLMHLFLVREPALDAFAHIHPLRRDTNLFEVPVPALPAGRYHVYADITQESGFAQTLTSVVELPGIPEPSSAKMSMSSDADDSWHVGGPPVLEKNSLAAGTSLRPTCPLSGGGSMAWEQPEPLIEKREVSLRFSVLGPDGTPAMLEPYMGMMAHAAIRRDDGTVFAHLHPVGTISMASQELFERRSRKASAEPASDMIMDHSEHMAHMAHGSRAIEVNNEVSFPYEFPKAGHYRIWVQVKSNGAILTGVFDREILATK